MITLVNTGINIYGQSAIGLAALPLTVIVHESGHLIASKLLFKDAQPKIVLVHYGYSGGQCICQASELSSVGKWIGEKHTIALISAAGPITDMITALALFHFFPGNGVSTMSLLGNFETALSALSEKAFYTRNITDLKTGQDFVKVCIYRGKLAANAMIISSVALAILALYMFTIEAYSRAKHSPWL